MNTNNKFVNIFAAVFAVVGFGLDKVSAETLHVAPMFSQIPQRGFGKPNVQRPITPIRHQTAVKAPVKILKAVAVSSTSHRYGKPYILYARRTNYTHHQKCERFRGKPDYCSAAGKSSEGPTLREATNNSPGIFAVSKMPDGSKIPKGSWLVDFTNGAVGIHADTIGTRWAAQCNTAVLQKKIKIHGHIRTVRHTVNLHKTDAQRHAAVVDECQNRPLKGSEYGNFLVIPRIDPRPFRKLKRAEQEAEIRAGFMEARLVQATYFNKDHLMAKR